MLNLIGTLKVIVSLTEQKCMNLVVWKLCQPFAGKVDSAKFVDGLFIVERT
jgi:hypothetical protein